MGVQVLYTHQLEVSRIYVEANLTIIDVQDQLVAR